VPSALTLKGSRAFGTDRGFYSDKSTINLLENMDGADISVYGEAKGEYTRQLCVFLVPCLESYFLGLLDEAKVLSPNPSKVLWHFQTLLQSIPDWNQDKVTKETELIQKECKCDYLEELLTAVFIAHTKVLSAIRLTTKQKKLQITIPKIEHFLHRVLSDSARALWVNAYLFADTNSIDKQKNLRQVATLLQDSVLQGIRGLLPVKSILREYLQEDDSDDEEKEEKEEEKEPEVPEAKVEVPEAKVEVAEAKVEVAEPKAENSEIGSGNTQPTQPTIYIDTKPSVTFSQEHIMFDSDNLENNEIHDIPFAEAELRMDDDTEIESVEISDDVLPMEADEEL
jgi:hypothetical protein